VAIRGYDTVAYFTVGEPTEGSDAYSSQWQGATWRFASQENLDLFEADPEKYAPQYGGYCAYGVAKDSLVKIEPENWMIVEDKLYLTHSQNHRNDEHGGCCHVKQETEKTDTGAGRNQNGSEHCADNAGIKPDWTV